MSIHTAAVTAAKPASETTLAFTQAAFEIREITPDHKDVGKFMDLHHDVLLTLPKEGKHWVKRRHFTSVKKHLELGHIALGVFAGNKMVGQVLLTFPDKEGAHNLKGYPIGTGNNLLPAEQCLIVQTLGVSTKLQGQGIRKLLLQEAEKIAHQKYRRHLLAKTDSANVKSVEGFKKLGYIASAETKVAGEAYKCVFMHKPLKVGGLVRAANHSLKL